MNNGCNTLTDNAWCHSRWSNRQIIVEGERDLERSIVCQVWEHEKKKRWPALNSSYFSQRCVKNKRLLFFSDYDLRYISCTAFFLSQAANMHTDDCQSLCVSLNSAVFQTHSLALLHFHSVKTYLREIDSTNKFTVRKSPLYIRRAWKQITTAQTTLLWTTSPNNIRGKDVFNRNTCN